MKRFLILFIITAVSCAVPLYSESRLQNTVPTYDEVHELLRIIPAEYQAVINCDFSALDDIQMLEHYISIGGDTAEKRSLQYFYERKAASIDAAVQREFGMDDFSEPDDDTVYKLADFLNQQMHTNFLRAYNKNCFTFSEIESRGFFDCVSATLLYCILLRRYSIPFAAVETADHVLAKVILPGTQKEIDVETTSYYGFDPGSKKEFQSSFGQTTGLTYVSPVNYKRRQDIPVIKLYALVVQNTVSIYTTKKDYLPAAQQASILRAMRQDESGETSFLAAMNNLTNLMVYDNNKAGNYEQSYLWIQDFPENQNKRAFLNNTYLSIVTKAEKNGNYQFGYDMLDMSLQYGIEKTNTEYIRFRRQLTNNLCINHIESRDFAAAKKLVYEELDNGVIPRADLLKLLKSTTTNESNYLYGMKQYKEAIKSTLDCLEYMPKDKTLVNNLKVYYKDYLVYLKTAKPSEVNAVLREAKKRFPNEKAFQDLTGMDFPQ